MDSVTRCPCHKEPAQKTALEIIEEVKSDICDKYCKYPEQYDNNDEMLRDVCEACALNRL